MKIVLAAPTYGPYDPDIEKALRVSMMGASTVAEWIGDVSTIREGWVGGRNRSVKSTLEDAPDADGIIWVDDDVLLPPTAMKRLLSYGHDFVTGVVFQKMGGFNPLVAKWCGSGFSWWQEFPPNVIAPADGCGFGICYTSTKMLRDIAALPSKVVKGRAYFHKDGWFDQFPPDHFGKNAEEVNNVAMSEDFSFCMRAKHAGYQLWADTGLLCSHRAGSRYATQDTFLRYQEEQKQKDAELKAVQERTLEALERAS